MTLKRRMDKPTQPDKPLVTTEVQAPGMLGAASSEKIAQEPYLAASSREEEDRQQDRIAGQSEKLLEVIRLAEKIAPTSVAVLITGESGTGKELMARLVHRQSTRADKTFIRVNCAAMSETLLESELFGHERGAFTGASQQHKGRFERANGGSLLLDEISETSPKLQAKLLRVLEQQDFERLGGDRTLQVDVRIISTTNRDLDKEIERGRFRRDLFYRINGINLVLPPLRERKEDLPLLVWHFVNLYTSEACRKIVHLDKEMVELFHKCEWPGNIRQLRNIVRTALIFGEGSTLSLCDIPLLQAELRETGKIQPVTLRLQELERRAILEALRRTSRNQAKAAQLLGITDRTLREKLRRYRQADESQTTGEAKW